MIVLAVDTAHAACSACVYDAGSERVLAQLSEPMQQGHAERLPAMVDEAVEKAGISLSGIDRLAACSGPGTFTGVRIGLAFIRGLALVLDAPALGITTFQALAMQASETGAPGDIWVVQDARRSEVYVQGFNASGSPICEAAVKGIEAAQAKLGGADGTVIGSGAGLLEWPADRVLSLASPAPDISVIARLAAGVDPSAAPPSPFYLRAPDAKAQAPLVRHEALNPSIRQVGADHAALLAQLHAQAFDEAWDVDALASLVNAPGSVCLLAVTGESQNEQPCGFVLARKAADEMEILTIAVAPSMRRRGVGKALLDELFGLARSTGASCLFIEYASDNPAAAALYDGAGFRRTGVRKGYYRHADGTRIDAVTARVDL